MTETGLYYKHPVKTVHCWLFILFFSLPLSFDKTHTVCVCGAGGWGGGGGEGFLSHKHILCVGEGRFLSHTEGSYLINTYCVDGCLFFLSHKHILYMGCFSSHKQILCGGVFLISQTNIMQEYFSHLTNI